MGLSLSVEDELFQKEIRLFLRESLSDELRNAVRNTPGIFMEAEVYRCWQDKLNRRGWLAYTWPQEYGGTGWSPKQRYIFERECALAGAPEIAAQGVRLLAPVLIAYGTNAQKAYFLPRILSGEHFWCQGYSEPGAGSDLASLKTRAVRDGDFYVVNGSKIWTTNAHFANMIFCLVRTATETKPQAGISFLLIDLKSPGIRVDPILSTSGSRELNQVFFNDARVPAENRVGAEGQGWAIAKYLLEHERGGSSFAPGLLADIHRLQQEMVDLSLSGAGAAHPHQTLVDELTILQMECEAMDMIELQTLDEAARGNAPGQQSPLLALMMSHIRKGIDRCRLEAYGPDALQLEQRRPLFDPTLPAPVGSQAARITLPSYLDNLAWSIMAGTDEMMLNIIAKTRLGL